MSAPASTTDVAVTELVELVELNGAVVLRLEPQTSHALPLGKEGQALLEVAALSPRGGLASAVPAGERAAFLSTLEAAWLDGRTRLLEHGLATTGGAERRFRTTLRRGTGHMLAVMVDITNAHHVERQWRDVESWLATLAETLPFDFWVCDAERRCVLQNPASMRRVGNLMGLLPEVAMQPEPSRAHFASAQLRALGGELVRDEIAYVSMGALRTFSRVVAPVRDGTRISGVLGLDLDITEIKEARDSLQRRERLAELGVMAATVAHEVRNPLGAISNAISLMRRRREVVGDGESMCRIVEDEVQRLDGMVVSLLEFARPVSASLERKPLGTVVEDALAQSLRADANSGRIRVRTQLDDTLEPVLMDSRLLNMAFTNVFRNALQAITGEGELHVCVDREVLAEGSWARVQIRDTGSGIPPPVKQHLFEPFVTSRSTGTGLGLTIVRRAIDAHRGQVDLVSDGARGTTCVIKLPLPRSPA